MGIEYSRSSENFNYQPIQLSKSKWSTAHRRPRQVLYPKIIPVVGVFSSDYQKYSCRPFTATVTSLRMTLGWGPSDAQMGGGCAQGSRSPPASSPKYGRHPPAATLGLAVAAVDVGAHATPVSPYMICGGMFETPPPHPHHHHHPPPPPPPT